jgi:hypothetical protein
MNIFSNQLLIGVNRFNFPGALHAVCVVGAPQTVLLGMEGSYMCVYVFVCL